MTLDPEQMACVNSRTALFFPTDSTNYAKPRRLCDGCSVRRECLADEMTYEAGQILGLRHGMYGGLNPAQRYSLERRGTPLRCLCGELYDPIDLRAGELVCARCSTAGYMEPLTETGDKR